MEIIGWYRDEQLDVNSDRPELPAKYVPFRNMFAGASRPAGDGWKPLCEPAQAGEPVAYEFIDHATGKTSLLEAGEHASMRLARPLDWTGKALVYAATPSRGSEGT
jgi:hypothetical protein